jgi:single-strand DNA-binding protein
VAGKKPQPKVTVVATGRIGSAPETVGAKGKLTKARMAVGQRVKGQDGEWADGPTMWFGLLTAGPQLADLSKGDLVTVEGRLTMRTWEDREGSTRYDYDIWVDKLSMAANSLDDSEFPVGA